MLKKSSPSQQPILPTYIAPNTELNGTLHVENNLLVDGIVHGSVTARGDIEVSPSGLVEGSEVRAKNLVVHGVLKARVVVEGKLTLSRTARLEGDITANSLSIENGAYYIGHIATGEMKGLSASLNRPELAPSNGNYYPS
ncbi:MAG TPA: polymer-forming cytoskeletal protein [Thermosynechococcaceae cyanobacterium]